MDDANSNWYERMAKAGWLGTKAQVSATKGSPAWKSSSTDAYGQALSGLQKKIKPDSEDESAGS